MQTGLFLQCCSLCPTGSLGDGMGAGGLCLAAPFFSQVPWHYWQQLKDRNYGRSIAKECLRTPAHSGGINIKPSFLWALPFLSNHDALTLSSACSCGKHWVPKATRGFLGNDTPEDGCKKYHCKKCFCCCFASSIGQAGVAGPAFWVLGGHRRCL